MTGPPTGSSGDEATAAEAAEVAEAREAAEAAEVAEVAEVDPITLEVVRNALVGIAEEAGAALRRTAYSPNIKERADCSTAVFDAGGRMVAQAEHIPVHLGSMPLSVTAARDAFPELDPGDQVLLSDPYAGGTHLPDWTLVAPVHHEDGVLLGYAANRAHHSDVGGAAPGSMPTGAVDIVAEGLRIPPVRLVVAGEEQRDLVALLLANTRTPDERLGDLRAQLGANHLAARRLRELAAAQRTADRSAADRSAAGSTPGGPSDGLAAAMAATLDHAERTVTAALRRLPDGVAHAEDVLDDDGAGTRDITIRASVTIADGHVTCDLTGSDAQVPGNVNCPVAVTLSAAVYALRAVIAPDVPANDGLRRALTLRTEPGTIVDARPPAAVAAGNVETSQRIVDVLLACFAQLTDDLVGAASQGTMNNTLLGGTD
ncbi:MAG: hydantoinase B/oxoprolinase family protein, partial [Nitriliruptor sp.]